MRLERLWVSRFKNLRDCELEFHRPHLLNAIIGGNGSGKSNVVEALLHILIGSYFRKAPPFDFEFAFQAQNRRVSLAGEDGRLSVHVDGSRKSLRYFAERLRDGAAQTYYPELTLVYYSGECVRVRQLIARYRSHFERLTRRPETDRYRPLFVQSSNAQAQVIVLALFAHGHRMLLDKLGLKRAVGVSLVLRSPRGFDPRQHEPKLWNSEGNVRRIVAAIEETAWSQESRRVALRGREGGDDSPSYSEQRTYRYSDGSPAGSGLAGLAERLSREGDNMYLALEYLRAKGIFVSAAFQLVGRVSDEPFEFDQLSEGEKQLLAVIGALKLVNRPDNFVLLDEPDTHLNPQWTWDYPSLLTEALSPEQRRSSTVLMATHTPLMISGMTNDQVHISHLPTVGPPAITRPRRHPRGQGVANLLCSSEYFGLPSSLDKETQKLLDERLALSVKETLTDADRERLSSLNRSLEFLSPGISERDPDYVAFLRHRRRAEGAAE